MIKQLKNYDVQTTPFIATKKWHLLNTEHPDTIFLELNSGTDLETLAVEYIDYSYDYPNGFLNIGCDVALEQQPNDLVIYEDGISGSGILYPNAAKNATGTYKRLVYHQILRGFYNNYHNPFQIFGIEQLDFQTSGMQRYLSNYFKVFSLSQLNFGDKIAEGSVTFVDNAFDDNYTVTDDSRGNLMAWPNLFSKTQEVRHIPNIYVDDASGNPWDPPVVAPPLTPSVLAAVPVTYWMTDWYAKIWWSGSIDAKGYYVYRTEDSGSNWSYIASVGALSDLTYYDTNCYPTQSYSYRVQAYNKLGLSGYTNTGSVSQP